MKVILILLFALMSSANAQTCPENRTDYFCIPTDKPQNTEITITKFYVVPSTIINLYKTEIDELNYPLVLNADWNSPYFGAGVSLYDNAYRLMILGGMTRMKGMTEDIYAAVVCHELGHLLGGDPKQTITGAEWASAEGQADHFSASQCLPRYFKNLGIKDENEISKRVEKAGFDFLNMASQIESDPKNKIIKRMKVNLPIVSETIINRYPTNQCRYETYRNNKVRPSCWFKN